jgi:capsular exopolysaccharide synthesis family protein
MSKNFELLQKLGKDQALLGSPDGKRHEGFAERVPPISGPSPEVSVQPGLEEVNALAQQIFLTSAADAPRIVAFASTEPGSGCSWVCTHLGEVLASRVAGTVCLVDANLRDPSLHQHFGCDNDNGISDALINVDPIRTFARSVSIPNLWLISAGSKGEESQALLSSDRMRLRIAELRREFDYVLIDTAAMNICNDAIGMGCMSDGVVMVLKANASRRETARQAIQDLQSGKAKVLGAVLNQRTFPIPDSIYKKL